MSSATTATRRGGWKVIRDAANFDDLLERLVTFLKSAKNLGMTPPTGAETGLIKTVVGALLKPFEIVVTPVAERVPGWLKRKPSLYVHFHPLTAVWCLANENVQPVMR